ncbi:MAG: bL17 family ribosomal protein [Firmicutes bacterium]|nr:bL17 family ribosomal protein [Bacillota bacterium]
MAIVKNQASYLLWYGRIETTLTRAKSVSSYTEKLLTAAINSYTENVKVVKTRKDKKGKEIKVEITNDGPKKLAARRKLMSKLYDIQEVRGESEAYGDYMRRIGDVKHPLIEKIFNDYAPKYDKRRQDLGQGGGYTRIVKLGQRNGDAAEAVILELV